MFLDGDEKSSGGVMHDESLLAIEMSVKNHRMKQTAEKFSKLQLKHFQDQEDLYQ